MAAYSGPNIGRESLRRWGVSTVEVGDMEEILADPSIDLVIVASSPALRPAQMRRAVQSERHVLCVHPVDRKPDTAYEAAMMAQDNRTLLLPLMAEAMHPAYQRFRELISGIPGLAVQEGSRESLEQITVAGPRPTVSARPMPVVRTQARAPECMLGRPQLLMVQRWLTGRLTEEDVESPAGLPGWDALRYLAGDIAEIMALSPGEELEPEQPLLMTGRFIQGLLFQATYFPRQVDSRDVWELIGSQGTVKLEFPVGWPGEARLTYRDADGVERVEEWPAQNPWQAVVERLERSFERNRGVRDPFEASFSWQEEVRALELDDAVRRSVSKRRASTLDFQEVTEQATFKGTMTLVGCSLLWLSLVLLIASAWVPWVGWFILPVFGLFLALQFLGWAVPQKLDGAESKDSPTEQGAKTPAASSSPK